MKRRLLRNALVVFGAASVGIWVGWALWSLTASKLVNLGKVYEGADAKRHLFLDPLLLSIPHTVGAAVAGLLLGSVVEETPLRFWAAGLLTTLLALTYGPSLATGDLFAGSAGPVVHSLQMLAICLLALGGLWLGRRFKRNAAVA